MTPRRQLLTALGAGALAVPLGCFAQLQGKVWRVGVLSPGGRPDALESNSGVAALRRELRELGYIEGENLAIEWRFADGRYERFPVLAADLVQQKMDLIVTMGPTATGAAQKVTTAIPIVMANSDDPVGSGFVRSLAHPGGNITGLSNMSCEIGVKQLEMLLSMAPKLSSVAVLVNPANSSSRAVVLKCVESATLAQGVKTLPVHASTPQEIEAAFTLMSKEKVGAVVVVVDSVFYRHAAQIAALAAKNRLPTISRDRSYAAAGGLMNYGPIVDSFQRVAIYVDKILKGSRPEDLPVEQPTKFELVINRKTAKAFGLTIPQQLLLQADKVIE